MMDPLTGYHSGMDLLHSAAHQTPWARALQLGLERYGPTPTYDAVATDLGYTPAWGR